MKNKRFVCFLLAVILVCLGFTAFIMISSCSNNPKIELFHAEITIEKSGDILVDEYIVTDFRGYEWEIKTGKNHINNPVYAGINYDEYKNDVASFVKEDSSYQLYKGNYLSGSNDVKDITDKVPSGDRYIKDNYIYVDARSILEIGDIVTFHYTFKIKGMVTGYKDCAELNYILFEHLDAKTKYLDVIIYLPDNNEDFNDIYCYGHGLSRGSVEQVENRQINYFSKNVGPEDDLEMRIVFPRSLVSEISENNIVDVNLKDKIIDYENEIHRNDVLRNTIAVIVNIITGLVVAGMVLITIYVYKKYDKEFTPKFDKEYLRELPYQYTPAEMGYLYYFGRTNDEDVTATLLDLIRRGFVKLDYFGETDSKDPDFTFILNHEKMNSNGRELLDHEKHVITWFFNHIGNGNEVTVKQIENYGKKYNNATQFETDGKRFKATIQIECKSRDWFINLKNGKSRAASFVFIPIVAGILFFIACSYFVIDALINYVILGVISAAYLIYVGTIKKRSVNGNEEFAKWKAFGHFLEDFSTMEDYPMPGIDIWEEYLVYATTLKLADKVMDQLKVKLPNLPENEGTFTRSYYVHRHYNAFYVTNSISNAINRAHYTAVSTISAHNSSSGGGHGHGGGFSSGSSFGGGGGGGRGMR